MIKLTITVNLMDFQIQGLYQLYLYRLHGAKGTKKDFISYMRTQVSSCGADEFLLSENQMDELSMSDVEQLMKWGLI